MATRRRPAIALTASLLLAASGCAREPGPEATGVRWPEADRLFQSDPQWVGGDGAFSIDLEDGRILWLFGDSFIAQSPFERQGHFFLRNSLAIQWGSDPSTAALRFYWATDDEGTPRSYVPERAERWHWPEHGVRLGDKLLLFYEVLRPVTSEGGPDDFQGVSWTAFLISNASDSPDQWRLEELDVPNTGKLLLGEAIVVEPPWLYSFGNDDDRHPIVLARWPLDEVENGDLSSLEWWCGDSWCRESPTDLIGLGAPELSVHFDATRRRYLMVHTAGHGPSTLAIRSAPRLEGPWSRARDILRPPESFEHGAFVYAGKAHPMLDGADLVATYVETHTYFPVFVKVTFP